MSLIPKLLLIYGGSILALTYLLGAAVWAADAYLKHGVWAMVFTLALASSIPALILAMVIEEVRYSRRWRKL